GKDRDVPGLQAIHRLLVTVEPDESTVLRHLHHAANLFVTLQRVITRLELVLEDICHSHEPHRAGLNGKGVFRGAPAAATATNEGNLNRVVLRSMDMRNGHTRESGDCGDSASSFQKFAT